MKKRKWIYIQKPQVYGFVCDICGGDNIEWSEFEHMIWCYDCKKDTPGKESIFDGPIGIGVCGLLGINFDRIELKTGQRLYMTSRGHKVIYCHKKPSPKYDPQYFR